MSIKGAIFDFNGVLLWDTHLHEQAWQLFAKRMRGSSFSDQEIEEHIHGRNNQHTITYLAKKALSPEKIQELAEEKEKIYYDLAIASGEKYCLSPGSEKLLTELQQHEIPYTIATASPAINIEFYFERLQMDRWFDRSKVVYDDGTRPGKPDPALFLAAAAKLGVSFGDCVLVEDSLSGLNAAYLGCAGRIVALGPKEKHQALQKVIGVDRVISRLDELAVAEF